ncbi:hypothetical protein ABEB36_001614 [Hypothenemus hampei]|uniref:Alpha-mannosidase n=1 Tax=Hypothenemus hampei TaxID=57062 RepID=A0ABD1FHP1_HYPHA
MMILSKSLIVFLCLVLFNQVQAECGYQSCHPVKDDQINIHLVPHSHDDLGWLKTMEQYYWGSHDNVQRAGVQYIITSVVEALKENKDRRFIYVETGFFWKWWLYQDEDTRKDVKELVNNGQLEFISGGWAMNDEAATYYQNTIDQMTWGLRKLNETFGACGQPKVAWQIDPFGHSREMASIFSQIGFDGFFLNRIDYADHAIRRENQSLEFVWRGSPDNLGESTDIYTNILFRHYSAPSGLCFDVNCNDEPVIDDPNSPEYNLQSKAESFVNDWIKPALKGYASNNVLVTMGDDFQYGYAGKNFINMDKLIKYMNSRSFDGVQYNVIYSTPSCYLNAVHQATNGTLKSALKTDDFFPYASSSHNYWTGYFSSRPTTKGYGRFSNNFLQICKQLSVLTNLTSLEEGALLDTLREASGVFQHHDGITGTEKENVAHDYMHLLHNGIIKCEELTNKALGSLVKSDNTDYTTCHMLNISECVTSETQDDFIITLYNPLGRSVTKYVRIPIVDDTKEITVTDPSGEQLLTQIIPIHDSVLQIPGRNSSAKFDLLFKASDIPALGYKQFYFHRNSTASRREFNIPQDIDKNIQMTHTNGTTKISIDEYDFSLDYLYYSGFVGNASADEFLPSTPYIFRPDPDIPVQNISTNASGIHYSGPLVSETQMFLNEWFSYTTRVYTNPIIFEFNYVVGPLPYEEHGVEVIARFKTNLEYDDKIYTDANGREIIGRVRNFRDTWNVTIAEPEAGNYYPIVTGVTLFNGTSVGFAILNDRAQGGGSLDYQNVEFMIHRNTIQSGQGVGEPLNETAFDVGVVSRGSHYVIIPNLSNDQSSELTPKELSQEIYLDSWIFFSSTEGLSFNDYQKKHVMEYSGLSNSSLPRNVHLLTLEPWGPSTVLLRLENFIGKEDPVNSGNSTVNIQDLFSGFKVVSLRETNLAANKWLEETERLMFNKPQKIESFRAQAADDFNVTLDPLQIRTFVVTISY